MPAPMPLPPSAVLVRHDVADFDRWMVGFEAHEGARRTAGILGHHVNRVRDAPNTVIVYLAAGDLEGAQAFAASDDLRQVMRDLGVRGTPTIEWMRPAAEHVVWDRDLPAMIIRHAVADFDQWLAGYDAADDLRTSRGIVGHAANQSLDDPNVAVVYHQADSFDALEAFLRAPELGEAMRRAGVNSEPEITYVTGGSGKRYE